MLEHLASDFRELLRQFEGTGCPLCGVLALRAHAEVEQVRATLAARTVLCGEHLQMILDGIVDPAARSRATRGAIEALLANRSTCGICAKLGKIELRLIRAIRRMDGQIRFRKALEAAPFFCRKHAEAVTEQGEAVDFADIQRTKISQLRDALAQAELLKEDSLEDLISTALLYLGEPPKQHSGAEIGDVSEEEREEIEEFARWEEARRLRHLAALETEAARLRYRNAALAEENRGLKLAYNASQAACRDLELDRSKLLAAVKDHDSDPLKPSNSR